MPAALAAAFAGSLGIARLTGFSGGHERGFRRGFAAAPFLFGGFGDGYGYPFAYDYGDDYPYGYAGGTYAYPYAYAQANSCRQLRHRVRVHGAWQTRRHWVCR